MTNSQLSDDLIPALFSQYETLVKWCDDFFKAMAHRHSAAITCHAGCDSCCTRETVTALEAEVIIQHIEKTALDALAPKPGKCIFLSGGRCTVYAARPLICRTHGLLLWTKSTGQMDRSCNLNYGDENWASLPAGDGLDHETITENLVRLNALFCQITGTGDENGRVALKDFIAD